MSEPTQDELILEGNRLFAQKASFVLGVAGINQLPMDNLPEIAFAGRSNVGKSSLINAVTGISGLARASNTPGRTQQLNYFKLDDLFYIVDLPGYGYAAAPEKNVQVWTRLIHAYLKGRVQLRRVFLLIDARHGIKQVDLNIMKMLDKAAVTYQIILTKMDKISKTATDDVLKKTQEIASKHVACYPTVLITSSEKKQNIDLVRAEFVKILKGI